MKKSVFIFSFLLLLAACSGEEAEKPVVEEEQQDKSEEVATLPQTDEEWIASSKESKWNEKQNLSNVEFAEPVIVNFEGDSIPEAVYPYSSKDSYNGYLVGKFDQETEAWDLWQNIELENSKSVEVLEKLTFEDKSEILLSKELDEKNAVLAIYRFSKIDNQIIAAARQNTDADKDIVVDPTNNSISYSLEGKQNELNLVSEKWIVGTDHRIYLKSSSNIFKEEYWVVIGDASIREFQNPLGVNYEEMKKEVGEPKEEISIEGGLCANYEDFIFCKPDNDFEKILNFTSKIPNEVTIEDFKKILGEPDSERLNDHPDNAYKYNYNLGDFFVTFSINSGDPKGNIDEISMEEN